MEVSRSPRTVSYTHLDVLTDILKLLHPFMPFLTEEIWQALPHEAGNEVKFLMLQSWPQYRQDLAFPQEEKAVELLMDAVKAVRARRSEMNVPPSKKAHLTIATGEQDIFAAGIPFLKRLGYASEVTVTGPSGLGSDKEEAARGVVKMGIRDRVEVAWGWKLPSG